MFSGIFKWGRIPALFWTALMIAAIALLDWRAAHEIPLGFLYLFPMWMAGSVLSRWQIAGIAATCTFLTEAFDAFTWNPRTGTPRDILYFAAFFCMGLFVYARREAEEQLAILIESSPAAIITADENGKVLMANEAAHRMLALPLGSLPARSIHRYLPSLVNVSRYGTDHQSFRTVMQARGQREDGEIFLADICFSTYRTRAGSRLAAMVLDASEDLRSREESGLHQLLAGSRIAVGAVSHEIRNVCAAIAVVHQNLSRGGALAENKDFEVLGNLVVALENIAAVDLRQSNKQTEEVDLAALLDDLRIVVAPSLREENIQGHWNVEPGLPLVWADRSNLMQVFLNLATNSIRALSQKNDRDLSVTATKVANHVLVEFKDNGGGVLDPERIFHPFQQGAQATGLGLYLSRAFMRSFGGELRYKPLPGSACFVVELIPAMPLGRE